MWDLQKKEIENKKICIKANSSLFFFDLFYLFHNFYNRNNINNNHNDL